MNVDCIPRLQTSVERKEYEEIEQPTGEFARQLLFVEEDIADSPSEVEGEIDIAIDHV